MNMMEVRRVSEWTASGIAIPANTLLICMALTEHNQTLKRYSRMIIVTALIDYLYVLGSLICAEGLIISDGAVLFISTGILSSLQVDGIQYVLSGIFIFTIAIVTFIVPIEYYYRWHLISR